MAFHGMQQVEQLILPLAAQFAHDLLYGWPPANRTADSEQLRPLVAADYSHLRSKCNGSQWPGHLSGIQITFHYVYWYVVTRWCALTALLLASIYTLKTSSNLILVSAGREKFWIQFVCQRAGCQTETPAQARFDCAFSSLPSACRSPPKKKNLLI